jgi:hypothetical protein
MDFNLKISGLDELKDKLERMKRNAQALNGQNIPLSELLDPPFMLENTRFNSFEDFLAAAGAHGPTPVEGWMTLSDEEKNQFVASHSAFTSWTEMQQAAGAAWARRQLFS